MLENVKTILGIKDDLQDSVLKIIIRNIESRLRLWLKQNAEMDTIPDELSFIVEEMAVIRFNKIGSEGMASESVEGHSVTFNEGDFQPYMDILQAYIPHEERQGKVMFF